MQSTKMVKVMFVVALIAIAFCSASSLNLESVATVDHRNASLHDTWTGGSGVCTNVDRRDLVYYNHANLLAISLGSTITSTYSWSGSRTIYCIEVVTNFGTTAQISSGGVGFDSTSLSIQSEAGRDLEAIIYIYGD
ncbi:uncharacterized protein LOC132696906 [Cylas formicarius]|uniref:uncharacterized protein LOC132696906 n=1 Tax=Cylas formicarius TaxID=197179 RepID=UPI0029586F95|nr:uncharacterized protein LOC132696906 [Cylas formicarius]